MSESVTRIVGAKDTHLDLDQCAVSRALGVGLQLTTSPHDYAVLPRDAVAGLVHALSGWLAKRSGAESNADGHGGAAPEQGEMLYLDGWITWYLTKDRAHVVLLWRSAGHWVSYPCEQVMGLARRLAEVLEP